MRPDEIRDSAEEAYIYGVPLMLMDITAQVGTAVPRAQGHKAPRNQFAHLESYPDPSFTEVVSPNADTLYSSAFLDLCRGPMILSVPDTGGRYYLMEMLDAWSNVFAAPGTRTTGNARHNFAIAGPNWAGTLPAGVEEIRSPTNMVWVIGRTYCAGPSDYEAVHKIQAQYKLTPLSSWGQPYAPPENVDVDPNVDPKTAPVDQLDDLRVTDFFHRLAMLMKDNPPPPADRAVVRQLAKIGIAPGEPFDPTVLTPTTAKALKEGFTSGRAVVMKSSKSPSGGRMVHRNGWSYTLNAGSYGTDYLFRAAVARMGLGANLPEDAVYPTIVTDANGQKLSGRNSYVLHFNKDQLPPARAFWSLTMYNSRHFFVPNPIGRYAIGDRDKLQFNADGSLDIHIQHERPEAAKEANWLPAPAEEFNIIMRIYWPKPEVLEGTWTAPPIHLLAEPKLMAA
jgi:hypothetical protein